LNGIKKMADFTMEQRSMRSHINAKVSHFYEKFFLNIFQFFGEEEIHYFQIKRTLTLDI
jgi:hypothetical protein